MREGETGRKGPKKSERKRREREGGASSAKGKERKGEGESGKDGLERESWRRKGEREGKRMWGTEKGMMDQERGGEERREQAEMMGRNKEQKSLG